MTTRFEPAWRYRLAAADAAEAIREQVEHFNDVEAGLALEPSVVFSRRRRIRARRRIARAAWIESGYAPLRAALQAAKQIAGGDDPSGPVHGVERSGVDPVDTLPGFAAASPRSA